MRLLQQRIGVVAKRVALMLLGAVAEQTNTWLLNTVELLHIKAAHVSKLQQVFRRALRVRAAVDEHAGVAAIRQHGGKRRAADTANALGGERRAG